MVYVFEVVEPGEVCGQPVLPGDRVTWHVSAAGAVVSIVRHQLDDHGRLLGALARGIIRPVDGRPVPPPEGRQEATPRPQPPSPRRARLRLVR